MDAPAYPQSRNEAFAQGNGSAPVSSASSIQSNVSPAFSPSSVLDMYENIPSGIGQDPRMTGVDRTKSYGITSRPPAVSGSNQGSSPMNV